MITGTFLGGLSYWGLRFIPTGDCPPEMGGPGFAEKSKPFKPKGSAMSQFQRVSWGAPQKLGKHRGGRGESPLVCPDFLHLPSKLDGAGKFWTHPVS